MQYTNEIVALIEYVLFILAVLLVPVSLVFMLVPEYIMSKSHKINRWVSTEKFFNKINVPIYHERFIYRHHRLFGALVLITSVICLYFLTIHKGINYIEQSLIHLSNSNFEEWLFVVIFYIILGGLCISFLMSIVIFLRPSALKKLEKLSNKWVDTDSPLKVFDNRKDLPEEILPGNPRVFGLVVFLGSVYIIWMTNPFNL